MNLFLKNLSVSNRVLIVVNLAVIIGFFFVLSVMYVRITSTFQETIEHAAYKQTEAHAMEISRWLDSYRIWLQSTTKKIELQDINLAGAKTWLQEHMLHDENIITFAYVNSTGNAVGLDFSSNSSKGRLIEANLSDRDYFKKIMIHKSTKEVVSNLIFGRVIDTPIIVIAHAILSKNKQPSGVLFIALRLDELNQISASMNVSEGSYGWMGDGNGLNMTHPSEKLRYKLNIHKGEEYGLEGLNKLAPQMLSGKTGTGTIRVGEKSITLFWSPVPNTPGWFLGISVPTRTFTKESRNLVLSLATIVVALLILLSIVITLMIRKQLQPIRQVVNLGDSIEAGNLNVTIDKKFLHENDEFGHLSLSMQRMAMQLKTIVTSINNAAQDLSMGSVHLTKSSQSLSEGSSEQAATLEQISASVEEMTESIKINTESSRESEKVSERSSVKADQSGQSVKETVLAMHKIAEKINVVQEIAGQTRLLALNASIEAARAGEFGRGFSVVASEVSKLADLSASAATEIEELTNSSLLVANAAGKELQELVPEIKKASFLMAKMATSHHEQEASIEEINTSLQHLNNVVQHNAAQAEELAATANDSLEQADGLKKVIEFFKI